jgi:hypothetical protein
MKSIVRYYVFQMTELGFLVRDPEFSKFGFNSEEDLMEYMVDHSKINIEYFILRSVELLEEE